MIDLTSASKLFDGKRTVTALDNVNLHITKGELVSIAGPSGSGKSTMLNLIGGPRPPGLYHRNSNIALIFRYSF
jgi:ABC-type lipoprotein export system ATPase subunit